MFINGVTHQCHVIDILENNMENRIHFGVRILAYLIDIAALLIITTIVFGVGGWLLGSRGALVPNNGQST